MTEPNPSPEVDQSFQDTVLTSMAERSEDWCVIISPLPDGLGWRAAMMIADGQICAGLAGDLVPSRAVVTAIGRGRANIEEIMSADREDEQLT